MGRGGCGVNREGTKIGPRVGPQEAVGGVKHRMLPAGLERLTEARGGMRLGLGPGRPGHREVVERDLHFRVSRISLRISCAADGMLVPGPKIAFTPAFFRKS